MNSNGHSYERLKRGLCALSLLVASGQAKACAFAVAEASPEARAWRVYNQEFARRLSKGLSGKRTGKTGMPYEIQAFDLDTLPEQLFELFRASKPKEEIKVNGIPFRKKKIENGVLIVGPHDIVTHSTKPDCAEPHNQKQTLANARRTMLGRVYFNIVDKSGLSRGRGLIEVRKDFIEVVRLRLDAEAQGQGIGEEVLRSVYELVPKKTQLRLTSINAITNDVLDKILEGVWSSVPKGASEDEAEEFVDQELTDRVLSAVHGGREKVLWVNLLLNAGWRVEAVRRIEHDGRLYSFFARKD